MAFSGAVKLTDLDDFLTPSQSCVKPLMQPNLIKATAKATATVSLSDCLACTGCVTSAETVLLQEQSLPKVVEALGRGRVVVSLSEQSVVSLAYGRKLSIGETFGRLRAILQSKGVSEVRDMQQARDLAIQASLQEFLDRFPRGQPLVCAECPGWVCYAEKKADPTVLPMLSTVKSPLLVQDHLVKSADPGCTHICVLPCYDKKLESHRVSAGPVVLTTKELEDWVRLDDWSTPCPEVPIDITTPGYNNLSSHGYAEVIFAEAAYRQFGRKLTQEEIVWKQGPRRDWSVSTN